jgi:hypothetical protein
MDAELIRKAAEAIYNKRNQGCAGVPAFNSLFEHSKREWDALAEVALQVFYEHTRGQTRERKPTICPDCNGAMKPTVTNPAIMVCSNCGRSV